MPSHSTTTSHRPGFESCQVPSVPPPPRGRNVHSGERAGTSPEGARPRLPRNKETLLKAGGGLVRRILPACLKSSPAIVEDPPPHSVRSEASHCGPVEVSSGL
jgi:hypothetical protein